MEIIRSIFCQFFALSNAGSYWRKTLIMLIKSLKIHQKISLANLYTFEHNNLFLFIVKYVVSISQSLLFYLDAAFQEMLKTIVVIFSLQVCVLLFCFHDN